MTANAIEAPESMWPRVARETAVFAASTAGMAALQAAFRVLAIHLLTVPSYGRVALIMSIFALAATIARAGLPVATTRLAARRAGSRGADQQLLVAVGRASALPTLGGSVLVAAATLTIADSAALALLVLVTTPPLIWSMIGLGYLRGRGSVAGAAVIQPMNALAQLLALGFAAHAGLAVGVGWVIGAYCIGNLAAFIVAATLVWATLRRSLVSTQTPPHDPELSAVRILRFSSWLGIATLSLGAVAVLARIGLSWISFEQVAYFDLALLIYMGPQLMRTAITTALVPAAAARHARNERVVVPGKTDLLLVAGVAALLDVLLWRTHVVATVLGDLGFGRYVAAEDLILIVMMAAPAEILLGVNSALLAAFGASRKLALASLSVLVGSLPLIPLAYALGARFLASLVCASVWALFLATRVLLREETTEQSILPRLIMARIPRRRAAG